MVPNNPTKTGASKELLRRFGDYERQVAIQNYRIGCILGIIFMPAGASLDSFVYPNIAGFFLLLRLSCSVLLGIVWGVLGTPLGRRFYRAVGLVEVALPLFFISWMISDREGSSSPYYAGLNLVLMGAGLVLRWGLAESIGVLVMTMGMYLGACFLHGPTPINRDFFNNIYFLLVTGVFIITGNFFYNRVRFREFALRHELDQNRAMLEESNRKLLELDQLKSRFFANISHELRTPLTLLLAPLESLMRRPSPDRQEVAEMLGTMHANGMRLLKLINDLLDLVRLESGRMDAKRERIGLTEFLGGLVTSARVMARDKRVRLETDLDPALAEAVADKDKLEKITLNLLFNAIKFTPAGGSVVLGTKHDGEGWTLSVRDTGMGIAPDHLPYIFDRFWQADSSSRRKYQGVGIGLALVRELVEVQGGSVTADSQVGQGTVMTVRLPWMEADAEREGAEVEGAEVAPAPDPEQLEWLQRLYRQAELFPAMSPLEETIRPFEVPVSGVAGKRPRLLVADDEPDMLRFLRGQLREHYEVLEAVDGHQAIEKAAQFQPDIILLDMMMPEKDGLEVCRELRERTGTSLIPIVMLTARADEETKLAALNAGANDFLTKPFASTELHLRLRNLFASYRFQRDLAYQKRILEATVEQLKETETQLVQSEKLASLGRLGAGIIHEINNPVNYAKTGLHMLKQKLGSVVEHERNDFEEVLTDVEDGINRVREIVSDLRSFTHPDSDHYELVPLLPVAERALRLLSNEWKGQVQVHVSIPEDEVVMANQNRLIQVMINLLQNSLDSLNKGPARPSGPEIWIEGGHSGQGTFLVVRDNGIGITRENAARIFDPFFTTKDVGQGTGLGLSICYRIIQDHGGRIRLRTEPGEFCEFTLEFPQKKARNSAA